MKHKFNNIADLKPTSRIRMPDTSFLICQGAKLAKPIVKDYYKAELGITDNPTEIIGIYTSAEVLFSEQVINGFEGADVTIAHPEGNKLTAENYSHHIIGTAKNVRADNGYLVADLIIKDKWAIHAIEDNEIKQISLGYSAQLDMTEGQTETGQSYQGQWVNMHADHVAIVKEGRCGDDCAIGDQKSKSKQEQSMKVTINGIEFDVGDNAPLAQAINNQNAQLDTLKKTEIKIGDQAFNIDEVKATQATIDKLVADKSALETQNADLKAKQVKPEDIEKMVADRAKTIEQAKKLDDKFVTDGKSTEQIKREIVIAKAGDEVVKAIVGDSADKAEQAKINTAFKVLVVTADSKPKTNVTDELLGGLNKQVGDDKDEKPFDKTKMWQNQ